MTLIECLVFCFWLTETVPELLGFYRCFTLLGQKLEKDPKIQTFFTSVLNGKCKVTFLSVLMNYTSTLIKCLVFCLWLTETVPELLGFYRFTLLGQKLEKDPKIRTFFTSVLNKKCKVTFLSVLMNYTSTLIKCLVFCLWLTETVPELLGFYRCFTFFGQKLEKDPKIRTFFTSVLNGKCEVTFLSVLMNYPSTLIKCLVFCLWLTETVPELLGFYRCFRLLRQKLEKTQKFEHFSLLFWMENVR